MRVSCYRIQPSIIKSVTLVVCQQSQSAKSEKILIWKKVFYLSKVPVGNKTKMTKISHSSDRLGTNLLFNTSFPVQAINPKGYISMEYTCQAMSTFYIK